MIKELLYEHQKKYAQIDSYWKNKNMAIYKPFNFYGHLYISK